MSKKDGGPAYPETGIVGRHVESIDGENQMVDEYGPVPGMTMRQHYKAAALTGILAGTDRWKFGKEPVRTSEEYAKLAGWIADAMLAEDEEHANG